MKVGIGTYSFGGIATMLGLGLTLKEKFLRMKELGYETVELLAVDLERNSVEDIAKWAQEVGIEVVSVHAEPTEEVIKKMAALGGKAVIWAGTPFNSREEAIEVGQYLDKMAEFAEPYGIKIGYHNHNHEFFVTEGKALLEHLLDNTTKCFSQLDCGWAQFGGMYPPYFIRKYKNRIVSIHVKENNKVMGPGEKPASRYQEGTKNARPNFSSMSLEEKKAMLAKFEAGAGQPNPRFDPQCKLGDETSNIDWNAIKAALDEQDFEAFWVVEREGFYDEHDKCLSEDCMWLRENIK